MTDISLILDYPKEIITPDMASKVLHCKPESIRLAARERPDLLGFPVIVMGSETKIPRIPFLRFLGYEAKEATNGKPQMESNL
jgi:hypothetical protein